MPLIDLQCHFGVSDATRAVPPLTMADALAYADQFGVETMCFASREAHTDLNGGSARLAEAIGGDARFRGWLTLSVHQPDTSHLLAAHYLRLDKWIGARFEQNTEADTVAEAGGHELLNGLRRYARPILLTVNSTAALHAAVAAAREFNTLRFLLNPQNEDLTSDMLPAVKEVLNISLVPTAAFVERDVIAQAVANLGERGERRVLWASDWGRFHPAAALGMIKDSALTAPQRDRILHRNARELMSG